ncbi:MAG: hypothetical protein KKD28_07555 [Chloroflexi bacterium]|nr:hypothetical protein [Chloroflexota bacterium]
MQPKGDKLVKKKVKFSDYKKYPREIMDACYFRDEFDELPGGAFFAIAEERGLMYALVEMAEWEKENTYRSKRTRRKSI